MLTSLNKPFSLVITGLQLHSEFPVSPARIRSLHCRPAMATLSRSQPNCLLSLFYSASHNPKKEFSPKNT